MNIYIGYKTSIVVQLKAQPLWDSIHVLQSSICATEGESNHQYHPAMNLAFEL